MYEKLIVEHYDEIFRYCCQHVESRQTAEDLCQDTFLSFLEHQDGYLHFGKAKNYLYTIAHNKCLDYYKKCKPVLMENLPESPQENNFEEDVEVRELLKQLPEQMREALILRYFQNLKFREIADIMEIGVSKAKYLVSEAFKILEKEVS